MIRAIRRFCSDYKWTAAYTACVATALLAIKVAEIFGVLP